MATDFRTQVDTNLYETLGVSPSAKTPEIHAAWRASAKRTHPDMGGDAKDFHAVETAYRVLSDSLERGRYDRSLRARFVRTSTFEARPHAYTTTQPPRPTSSNPHDYASYDYRADPGPLFPWSTWVTFLILAVCAAAVAAFVFYPATALTAVVFAVPAGFGARALRTRSMSSIPDGGQR